MTKMRRCLRALVRCGAPPPPRRRRRHLLRRLTDDACVALTDHVFVKADLSNLAGAIQWCKTHDAECQEMVSNARKKAAAYLSKEGLTNYVELVLCEIASR